MANVLDTAPGSGWKLPERSGWVGAWASAVRPPAAREDDALRHTLAASVLPLIVAMGIGRFAYTPILPAMQGRFDLSNAGAATLTMTYARQVVWTRRADLGIDLLTAAFGVGQVPRPPGAAALAGTTGGIGPALIAASAAAVALGGLLMPTVGLAGLRGKAARKEGNAEL